MLDKKACLAALAAPDAAARGLTRWWWYGCAVDRAEICRELDEMKNAGIGGVELQVLYALQPDDAAAGVHNRPYLSPEYLAEVAFAARQAHERGLRFEVTLGSSWPYGGPFIPQELCAENALPCTIDVQGPCLFSQDLTTVVYGQVVGAVMGRMQDAAMLPHTLTDVRPYLRDKYLFEWPWGKEIAGLPVPPGLHKIVLFVLNDRKLQVHLPMPGAQGPVMDHHRREALRCFLHWAGDCLVQAVGEGAIDGFFCDSLEVEGHNWTPILYEQFARRRGYDLHPYLYALWGQLQGLTPQVRYDFHKTLAELTQENFFEELTAWCREKGAACRIQAHGTWGDILRAYGAADVPEGETFSAQDCYRVNTVHRRLAVSAGHIYGRPVISNESFTWLRFPRFAVSPAMLKAAADAIFLDGINQIVNHGYSYTSPPGGEQLAFYASSHLNHTNTWWRYYPILGRYINRVCQFMRMGRPVVETAIYLPQHDVWAEMPLADIHMAMKLEERLDGACVDAIHKAGYWFDYINDDVLESWQSRPYRTILLIGCERIPLAPMRALCAFAAAGGKVIAAGALPRQACGLVRHAQDTAEILRLGEQLAAHGAVVAPDRYDGLLAALRAAGAPPVQVLDAADTVGYVHRRDGEQNILFVANVSQKAHTVRLRLRDIAGRPMAFDPMTGGEVPFLARGRRGNGQQLTLRLEACQSLLVLCTDTQLPPSACPTGGQVLTCTPPRPAKTLLQLQAGWRLQVPQKGFDAPLPGPRAWQRLPGLRWFSGTGRYTCRFALTAQQLAAAREGRICLALQHVEVTAEVWVNGRRAGVLLQPPWQIEVGPLLQAGENLLRIDVTNLLLASMLDPARAQPPLPGQADPQQLLAQWPYVPADLVQQRMRRLHNGRERQMAAAPPPAGLWGAVRLVCLPPQQTLLRQE